MKRIAIFASGSGSDMQSVLDAINEGKINGKVVYVVSNKNGIYALDRAKAEGIECGVYRVADFGDKESRDRAICDTLKSKNIELVVLAGYLGILTEAIVSEYKGKIINIHPSLIPKYCGDGFYGMKVHEAVIKAGEKESGCTVHFVDEGTDTGAIIKQVKVPVLEGDKPESLQQRILIEEHKLLPEVVASLCK